MRLRLTQPGYETFTGLLGAVQFTDGLTDYGVSEQQAGGILIVVSAQRVDITIDTEGNMIETPRVDEVVVPQVDEPEAEPVTDPEPEADPETEQPTE